MQSPTESGKRSSVIDEANDTIDGLLKTLSQKILDEKIQILFIMKDTGEAIDIFKGRILGTPGESLDKAKVSPNEILDKAYSSSTNKYQEPYYETLVLLADKVTRLKNLDKNKDEFKKTVAELPTLNSNILLDLIDEQPGSNKTKHKTIMPKNKNKPKTESKGLEKISSLVLCIQIISEAISLAILFRAALPYLNKLISSKTTQNLFNIALGIGFLSASTIKNKFFRSSNSSIKSEENIQKPEDIQNEPDKSQNSTPGPENSQKKPVQLKDITENEINKMMRKKPIEKINELISKIQTQAENGKNLGDYPLTTVGQPTEVAASKLNN